MVGKVTISDLLRVSDKTELVEWVRDNVDKADRCIVLFGVKDDKGGMMLGGRQVGFSFDFEIAGFCEMIPGLFVEGDPEDEQEG